MLLVFVIFMVVPHITFCFQGISLAQSTAMKVKIGQKAPDFTLKSLDGTEITLSDYFGKKVVMLEFWATWCNICKKEIPNLVKNYNDFKDRGFVILGITLQSGEDAEIQEVVNEHGIPYPILIDDKLTVATKVYGLAGPIPLKVIIGADGVVKYSHVGDYPPGEDEVPFVVEDLIQEIAAGQ
ncbi:MAG: TlpA family protein disulfide reductase [bacterium]|nr:MAG: TlpA family protein disulfide reductase [bacterium]